MGYGQRDDATLGGHPLPEPAATDPPTPPTPPSPPPNPPPNPNPNPPQPTPPTPPTPPPPTAPTQADIDAAVAKALGVPLKEAKAALDKAKQAERAGLDEAQRAKLEADEAKQAAATAASEAKQLAQQARVQLALVRAGVHPDKLEWAARLVDAPADADDKGIQAAIETAKAAVPEVFAGTAPTNPVPPAPGPPSSNPPGTPPAPKPTGNAKEKAAAMIRERFPNLAPTPPGGGSA